MIPGSGPSAGGDEMLASRKLDSRYLVGRRTDPRIEYNHTEMRVLPLLLAFCVVTCNGFAPSNRKSKVQRYEQVTLRMINQRRRNQLGIGDDEDEYDLDEALRVNTDDTISKIVAGSFIAVMIALLYFGLIQPSITDYGEGVCSPIQNGGRC